MYGGPTLRQRQLRRVAGLTPSLNAAWWSFSRFCVSTAWRDSKSARADRGGRLAVGEMSSKRPFPGCGVGCGDFFCISIDPISFELTRTLQASTRLAVSPRHVRGSRRTGIVSHLRLRMSRNATANLDSRPLGPESQHDEPGGSRPIKFRTSVIPAGYNGTDLIHSPARRKSGEGRGCHERD